MDDVLKALSNAEDSLRQAVRNARNRDLPREFCERVISAQDRTAMLFEDAAIIARDRNAVAAQ